MPEGWKKPETKYSSTALRGHLHGFFALGIRFWHVQESFTYINQFLGQYENRIGQVFGMTVERKKQQMTCLYQ